MKSFAIGAMGAAFVASFGLMACSGDDGTSTTEIAEVTANSSANENAASSANESAAGSAGAASSANDPAASSSSDASVVWNKANLTWYESYPDEGSEECIEYNGCEWAGWFAGLEDQQTPEWVAENNIIAVHEKDWAQYKLKTFRLRKGGHEIDAVVYDMCSDDDCDGCCTKNAGSIGFLIDIEVNTKARFGNQGSGVVEWTCIDCE